MHDRHNDLPFCPEHICIIDLIDGFKYPLDHMEISNSKEKKISLNTERQEKKLHNTLQNVETGIAPWIKVEKSL